MLGTALGLFVSAFAATRVPGRAVHAGVVLPQLLLCGLFVPRDQLPPVLEGISDVLPMSYAVDAMTADLTADVAAQPVGVDLLVVGGLLRCRPGARAGCGNAPPSNCLAGAHGAVRRVRQAMFDR